MTAEVAVSAHRSAWRHLADDLVARERGVENGRMMSSEAVTLAGKVFVFHTTKGRFEGLGLRLGRDYDVEALKLVTWEYLAPFKSKPPMKDWILVGIEHRDRWPELAAIALERMRAGKPSKK